MHAFAYVHALNALAEGCIVCATGNDILPEIIEHRVMAEPGLAEVKQFLHRENEVCMKVYPCMCIYAAQVAASAHGE